MSDTAKQSPLGVNSLGSILQNIGFTINPTVTKYLGSSKTYGSYTMGTMVNNSCLRLLTYAINDAYTRGVVNSTTYNNLIAIGSNSIPALGNSKPPTFTWDGAANTGDPTSEAAQVASWLPYNNTNGITQWGYFRLNALQAWNEFNWNGTSGASSVEYKDFCSSYQIAYGYIEYTNVAINALESAPTFLAGTYSNMDDLISADITGVNLATPAFGRDLITLGKVMDFTTLSTFGLPSNLLRTINKYNAITQSLSLALIASELQPNEVEKILNSNVVPTTEQEKKIYSAFLIILGADLYDVLVPLNCKTQGLESLADLLNPMKMFPESYQSLTVPIYNEKPGPTNSKTYYPIYGNGAVNSALSSPVITEQIGGPQTPGGTPNIQPSAPVTVVEAIAPTTNVEFVAGPFVATQKAVDDYQKLKSTPPGPGYVWDSNYDRWLSPDQVALSNMSRAESRAIYREYIKEKLPGQDFIVSGNPGQNPEDVIAWAKEKGLLKPYGL